ncbi:DedA family protein [Candidatus Cyanaurora vandensis]|uniref:DedA family protein n=1 Tax=Candidatus Cyanaurora vandensis TaxID=2714958 RepID=UPI0025807E2F|nr:DedA family protein [Candidatus Cyanaurora vandensis]
MTAIQQFIETLVQNLQPFLEANGYWLIALIIFLENSGIPLPGETILIISGVLASQGRLQIAGVLLAAITGAILGDNMGYFIGKRYGRNLVLKYGKVFGMTPAKFAKAEAGFLKNSAWAVFFGRFIVLLRILAGPLAGITNMPWPKFFIFNALGAISWATAIGGASYFFGKQVEQFFQSLGIWSLVIALGGILVYTLLRETWEARKLKRELAEEESKGPS